MDCGTVNLLFPDFRGELSSKIIGVVYLSLPNFISVACLIMRSHMSVWCGSGLVRDSTSEVIEPFSGSFSDGCISSVFKIFSCNF